ncbi:hypothetical protein ACFCXP_11345 [Streptomyces niveus]|uniref:hypothetical protein n=1 Tax=Streptomyces niveus TaxID=193462 RepID=UPI0035D738C7
MAETTDPRTVPTPPVTVLPDKMAHGDTSAAARVRMPSAELDQLRAHAATLQSIRQAVINLCAGRPDTHMMTVGELRAAVIAPPAAGVALPVTWSGNLVGPTGGGRSQTLLPLVTSYGTPACLAVDAEERARLAGLLAATLHPAETCRTPGCGATEAELDLYADDDDHHLFGWIAVRVSGAPGPIRWWCSQACANSAITAGAAELAAVDRADAGRPSPANVPVYTDRITGGALTRMMATAAAAVSADAPIPYDLDERYGDGAADEYVNQLGEAADAAADVERGDVDGVDASGGAR